MKDQYHSSINCNQCQKSIGEESSAWLSNRQQDWDFCSEDCYDLYHLEASDWLNWNEESPSHDLANDNTGLTNYFSYPVGSVAFPTPAYSENNQLSRPSETAPLIPILSLLTQSKELSVVNEEQQQDWTEIHADFAKKPWRNRTISKTCQEIWQDFGITYQEASEWVKAGLQIISYKDDHELVVYARGKNYRAKNINRKELREEYDNWKSSEKDANECLELFYPLEIKKNVREINIPNKNLTGDLVINGSEWPNLTEINASGDWKIKNNLTSLIINDCEKLTKLECFKSQLTSLTITNCPNLTELNASYNKLTDLTIFSQLVNLEILEIFSNKFTGSLEPLKNLVKLEKLDIGNNTKLTFGLEYLSDSLEKINYANLSKELRKELIPFGGKVQAWKEAQEQKQQIARLRQEKNDFSEQKQEISYLEKRIQELTNINCK